MTKTRVDVKQVDYLSFLNRENSVRHHYYDEEMKQYELMKRGDPAAIEEGMHLFNSGLYGHISDDPLRNVKYIFVASTTLATRFAIEGGLDSERAYTISDLYILKMDQCQSIEAVSTLHRDMFTYFTQTMASLKKATIYSKPIRLCLDYIDFHLHEPIPITTLAHHVALNTNYLSTLFKKEIGSSISAYIKKRRIEAAQSMLKYSDFSYADIASYLSFSSQSYFIRVFKSATGYTPKEYRTHYFRTSLEAAH